MIQLKRVYEEPAQGDDERILVDRLWPRGLGQADARLSAWLKELAPSPGLRRWFAHGPERWEEFQLRYEAELASPEKQAHLRALAVKAAHGTVTLLFAAKDTERNNAVVLKKVLDKQHAGPAVMAGLPANALHQAIVENASDGIVFADSEGVIRLWNKGAEAIFGYRAEEAVGETLDLIVPERQRERHWEGYRRAMATGESRYGRGDLLAVPAVRKDGTRISLEFTIVLVHDERGGLLGPAAIIRDVTERWQRERATRDRLAELEAQVASLSGREGAPLERLR